MSRDYSCQQCVHCGADFYLNAAGATVHLDEDGEHDYEADGDHIAYSYDGD